MLSSHFGRTVKMSIAALIVVAALGFGLRFAIGGASREQPPPASEPPAAAAFIVSQRGGDVATASQVTSRLYYAELDRRGLDTSWPLDPLWQMATSELRFSFVLALANRDGFTSALYAARPKDADSPATLWRLDLDPGGKVIWGDFLWLFSDANVRTVSMASAPARVSVALSHAAGPSKPCLIAGIVSAAGDGYLALDMSCSSSTAPVAFATVDTAGTLRPGFWSFGDLVPASAPSTGPALRVFDLTRLSAEDARTLQTYETNLSAQSVIGAGLSGMIQ